MFKKRWFRVVFSAILGSMLVEVFYLTSSGELQLNFIAFAIPINLIIIFGLYVKALIKNNKELRKD
jgi:hypothetical protein